MSSRRFESGLLRGLAVVMAVFLCADGHASNGRGAGQPGHAPGAEAGWTLLKRGEYRSALDAFALASEAAPAEPSVLLGLGLAYHLVGRSELAIGTLERAIHVDGSMGDAYLVLGDLYARRGELERAIHHYEMASARLPREGASRARLERARRAYRAELGYDRLYTAHFAIQYPASELAAASVRALADRLERTYRAVGEALAYFPEGTCTVIVHPDERSWSRTESPAWVRALFSDGVIHLRARASEPSLGISDAVLRHEYAHVAVDQLSAGRAPVWLNEGLALHLEGGHHAAEGPAHETGSRGREEGPTAGVPWSPDFVALSPVDARAAYAHSYKATMQLIQRYGLPRVRALLVELSHVSDFSRAFETAFGTGFQGSEEAWPGAPSREGE